MLILKSAYRTYRFSESSDKKEDKDMNISKTDLKDKIVNSVEIESAGTLPHRTYLYEKSGGLAYVIIISK